MWVGTLDKRVADASVDSRVSLWAAKKAYESDEMMVSVMALMKAALWVF